MQRASVNPFRIEFIEFAKQLRDKISCIKTDIKGIKVGANIFIRTLSDRPLKNATGRVEKEKWRPLRTTTGPGCNNNMEMGVQGMVMVVSRISCRTFCSLHRGRKAPFSFFRSKSSSVIAEHSDPDTSMELSPPPPEENFNPFL